METKIPILKPHEIQKHHFGDLEWKPQFAAFEHLFQFNRIENVKDLIKFPIPPHRKMVYDFIFLTEGSSIRSKGLQEYSFSKNMFFFLPAYQITTHKMMSTDAKGFFCSFNPDILDKSFPHHTFFENFSFLTFIGNPIVEVDLATKNWVINLLERLESEYAKPEIKQFDIVSSYLFCLFNEVNQFVKTIDVSQKNAAQRITESYKNALSQHIYTKQKVTEYADLLAISPDHLGKCVRTITGKSSQELLIEMLILEAKVLIRQTNLSISEIAFKISEKNLSDFSRFFKTYTGLTPKEYRNMTDFT
jgi:AraC family transcriptional regulator, transcriptional activator of pobA